MEEILSGVAVPAVGGFLSLLLGVIAFFLSRLLCQFDQLTEQVGVLNETMKRIDKDLSGDVGIIKTQLVSTQQDVDELNQIWDRMRSAENEIIAIKNGGCSVWKECKQ